MSEEKVEERCGGVGSSYAVLWSHDRAKHVVAGTELLFARNHRVGLANLYGGPHTSMPSYVRFGVRPGDWIYPFCIMARSIRVLGRAEVHSVLDVENYFRLHAVEPPEGFAIGPALQKLSPDGGLALWTCCSDVVTCGNATRMSVGNLLPPESTQRLTFVNSRGQQRVPSAVAGGIVKSAVGFQGKIFRLAPQSAADFASALGQLQ